MWPVGSSYYKRDSLSLRTNQHRSFPRFVAPERAFPLLQTTANDSSNFAPLWLEFLSTSLLSYTPEIFQFQLTRWRDPVRAAVRFIVRGKFREKLSPTLLKSFSSDPLVMIVRRCPAKKCSDWYYPRNPRARSSLISTPDFCFCREIVFGSSFFEKVVDLWEMFIAVTELSALPKLYLALCRCVMKQYGEASRLTDMRWPRLWWLPQLRLISETDSETKNVSQALEQKDPRRRGVFKSIRDTLTSNLRIKEKFDNRRKGI